MYILVKPARYCECVDPQLIPAQQGHAAELESALKALKGKKGADFVSYFLPLCAHSHCACVAMA